MIDNLPLPAGTLGYCPSNRLLQEWSHGASHAFCAFQSHQFLFGVFWKIEPGTPVHFQRMNGVESVVLPT